MCASSITVVDENGMERLVEPSLERRNRVLDGHRCLVLSGSGYDRTAGGKHVMRLRLVFPGLVVDRDKQR